MKKWAIINDWHIPRHDKRKIKLWFNLMREWKPDYITINGDFDDFTAPSRWVAGTPTEFVERISVTTEAESKVILRQIREEHPDAVIDWLDGNHEVRLEDYVAKNAPALVDTVTIKKIFELDELEIEYQPYGDPPKQKFGGLYIHHGTFISKNAGESVRKEMEHYGVGMIMGHTHRLGSHRISYLDGRILRGWEGGHMTDLKQMDYAPFHNWQHGFLTGYVDNNSCFIREHEFIGNKLEFEGELHKA